MSVFTKVLLSGSTNGRPIKVGTTSTPGTLVHTAIAGTSSFDEIWIYANNTSASTVKLTIEFGGTTNPDDLIEVGIPSRQGLVLIAPGFPIQNEIIIRAFSGTADVINITGWVNRIV